ncbi:hypothetical protein SAMN04488075_0193 [Paracoccus alkenifer]|uniref:Uncharacterized protein n=1 Tax=Paracoccus alkenifer TaxID=65735 RepID=A0A1H6JH30_9RHOB|nr:hypothetical protein SAMN04488075_0193 [Paracoccus alkenifer]
MIGAAPARPGWAQALAVSLLLHGAGGAAVVWRPDWQRHEAAPGAPVRLELDLSALNPTARPDAPTLTPVTAADAGSETLAPVPPAPVPPAPVSPDLGAALPTPLLPDIPLVDSRAASESSTAPAPDAPETAPAPDAAPGTAPTDPRLAELFDRIRGRLGESCLLALPALLGEDQIQLGVLAADDRRVAGLMRELTRGLDTGIVEAAVLLDPRQCPALDFIRRDPRYPLPGLGLQIETPDIASGDSLRGRLSGTAGLYTTLLLVDDNGVVHDLRRFQIAAAGATRFEVPLARSGGARDTHQLVLAIASAVRPDTVATHAGETAAEFFDRLSRDPATADARLGIGSIYVR